MNAVHAFPETLPVYRTLETRFDVSPNPTLWTTMLRPGNGQPPYFSPELLAEMGSLLSRLQSNGMRWHAQGATEAVQYVVLRSEHPHYFNLGGDLAYFHDCIQRRDRERLFAYSLRCADMLFDLSMTLGHEATTIALVQGRAMGGGFETALAADFIVAEEQAEFGFPEILFGLFPCTGGMSLLAQRVGLRSAERMLSDGKIYGAAALKEMGVVDEICATGEGAAAVERFIAAHSQHRPARLMLQRGRRRLAALDLEELRTVVDEWATIAMTLQPQQLRVMEMLMRMQRRSVAQ